MRAFRTRSARLPPTMSAIRKYCATRHIARRNAKTNFTLLASALQHEFVFRYDFMMSEFGLCCLCSELCTRSFEMFFVFRTQHVTSSKNYNTTIPCSNHLKLGITTTITHENISTKVENIRASLWRSTRWRAAKVSFQSSQTTRRPPQPHIALWMHSATWKQTHCHAHTVNTTYYVSFTCRLSRCMAIGHSEDMTSYVQQRNFTALFTQVAISHESCYNRSDGTVNESRNVLFIAYANEMKVGLANCTWH